MIDLFKRIPIRIRLSVGLVGLMTGTLLFASAIGFFPNEQREVMRGRAALCESLAISGTAMASSGSFDDLRVTLKSIMNRNKQIVSVGLRGPEDQLIVWEGPHTKAWVPDSSNTARQMQVPIFRKGERFGNLEVAFADSGGFLGLNYWAPAWLLVILIPACLVQFSFFLRKTLQSLDPSGAVPKHVRGALDTLTVGLLLLDTRDRILFANRLLADEIGIDPDKMVGTKATAMSWIQPTDETAKGDSELPWIESMRAGTMVSGRVLHYDVDGRRLTFIVNCTPILGQGLMVTFEDITELEENKAALAAARDAAEQANRSKSAFLANMSHEIRTPMNAILGFTEVLRRNIEHDETKRQRHLNTIHSSGTHLLNLINDILDLSKIEADRLEVESIPCALHRVIADVVTVMRVRADEKAISLDYQFDGPIPEAITSDPARLRQILTNLVGNAIKFTEQGGVRILTQLDEGTEGRPQMVIRVVDSGIGMTPQAAARIFDPFSQADASVTRRFGGTGLGLSISRRFAEALGGGITVTSEPGVGSVFVVRIDAGPIDDVPRIVPSRQEMESSTEDEEHLVIRLPEMSVLLVDDGDENRDLMSVVLEEAGADYDTAENGLEAVKKARLRQWDVILMDMQMPVMDGYTATRKLREEGYDKPIIALTAHAMQGAEQECLDAGCTGFLTKPIDFDRLIVTLAGIAGVDVTAAAKPAEKSDERDVVTGNVLPAPETPAAAEPYEMAAPTTSVAPVPAPAATAAHPIRSTLPMHKERFRSIVAQFVDRLDQQFDVMEEALRAADADQISDLGHWLKGASGNCGFAPLAEVALRLESCGRQADLDSVPQILGELRELRTRIEVPSAAGQV